MELPGRSEMEVGREADKGMPRARYCMCAFQFDLTPLISLLGRRSTAQGNGRGYYTAAAARWNKVRLRPRAHIFGSDLTPLPGGDNFPFVINMRGQFVAWFL